jgi:hypothetical protein
MIPNCAGCQEEFRVARDYVSRGYFLATTSDRPIIGEKDIYPL